MAATLENIVGRWLRRMTISVSPHFLREKLQSHPDYPSLLSVTDTLDELGIDNAALQIDKEMLQEAPLPFLAHHTAKGEFVIIDNINKQVKPGSDFEKNWNGAALLGEKPENWRHAENEKRLTDEKKSLQTLIFSVLFVVALAALTLVNGFSWQLTALLVVSLCGLAVAILIVQEELGIHNELTEKLCHAGKNTDCRAVMHSKGSWFPKWLNPVASRLPAGTVGWADAGIIYFTAYNLLLIAFLYSDDVSGITILAVLSAAAMPFTFFSLYLQWQVVKKWCPLCLITVAVLWGQAALLYPVTLSLAKGAGWSLFSFTIIAFTVFIFSVIGTGWFLLLKPSLESNKKLTTLNFSLRRFKNNPALFEILLLQQRQVDTTPFKHDLQLCNAAAPVQILVACNPYCGPCATAHEALHELAKKNDIGLTVRLTIKHDKKDDIKTQAADYILCLLYQKSEAYKKQALHDWYAMMNMEQFALKYPVTLNGIDITEQLKRHEQWTEEAVIKFTPTIFINGYELPKQYNATDLATMVRYLNAETTTIAEPAENNYASA